MVKLIPVSSDIILYAFRYCLGRETYVVSDFVHSIIEKIDDIDIQVKFVMIRDIDKAEQSNELGMGIDKAEWLRFRNKLKESVKL